MRAILLESLAELAKPVRGLRVLLYGFSGRGFPGGDGAIEAAETLPSVGIETAYTHALDPELEAKLSRPRDITIICNTRVAELHRAHPLLWAAGSKRVWWHWDLRPGTVAAPLRGRVDHVFLSYNGRWDAPDGTPYVPSQWATALGCPVGYAPQASPLREPVRAANGPRIVFVGDLANRVYHQGRAEIVRAIGATVVNERQRDGRLAVEARMPELYRSARYVLSMSPRAPGYTSVRTYSILACGGLMVLHRFPGADDLFRDGEHAILFDGVDDLRERLDALDNDEPARERIAAAGRRLHAERHTVAHRVLSICRNVTGADPEFAGWL